MLPPAHDPRAGFERIACVQAGHTNVNLLIKSDFLKFYWHEHIGRPSSLKTKDIIHVGEFIVEETYDGKFVLGLC